MPIYEYQCGDCGTRIEVMQKMSEAPLKTCTGCGKDALEKLISQSAFQLKGGGWYSDLYGSTRKDSGTAEKKTETKAETKTETKAVTGTTTPSSSSGSTAAA
ncbi:MAG: zinc ribbon domain-containing protein [Deltaproteobacteria bacterium]|nr:zinc ribbon domain-containing protein [Deltaproteobacteria bacterium]